MITKLISIYKNIRETKNGSEIPVDIFFESIRNGKWQDIVLPIRAMEPAARDEAKKRVPYVTLSGTFSERTDNGLREHSGLIGIDIDDVDDPEELKSLLCPDPYILAAFRSISGRGLCLVFKINPDKHRESFQAISQYLFEKYQVIIDPTSINPSRARFVSFDPHIYINPSADKFTRLPKVKQHKPPDVVFVQSDFDIIIQQIHSRQLDLTSTYQDWLRIGFALSDKFGESGRGYFHQVSQFNPSYSPSLCDRQYTNCLKAKKSGITIATFYYLAKAAGIETITQQTRTIQQAAYQAKKGRRNQEDTVRLLAQAEGIDPNDSAQIIQQVFSSNITPTDDNPIEALELYLRSNYSFRRNSITRYIEHDHRQLQAKDFNTIYIAAKKVFEKLTFELLERVINSDFTPDYNPLLEFFQTHKSRTPSGAIRDLFNTIESDTGLGKNEFFPDFKVHFGTKWLVGMIASIHGQHCPLMMILSGNKQNTGKTEWWRRLLPKELRQYYAESKLDAGKDDEILMTQKIIIMDDEMGGKSKKETKRLKELTSKQTFSLREPYGRNNVDLQRLAMLCGTTNDNEILNDPTGNRRIIPINVLSIDHAAYNRIDKIDVLMEAYHLYIQGFEWELSARDVKILNDNTGYFEEASAEYELLTKFYQLPKQQEDSLDTKFLTATELKADLERRSMQKLNITRLGMEMKRLGWHKTKTKRSGFEIRGYYVREVGTTGDYQGSPLFGNR